MSRKVRCLVVRVGHEPVAQELATNELGRAVGGSLEMLLLEQGPRRDVIAFVNDEGVIRDLPPNRILPTAIPYFLPSGAVSKLLPIRGDFVVLAASRAGNELSLTDEEVAEWATRLELPRVAKAAP